MRYILRHRRDLNTQVRKKLQRRLILDLKLAFKLSDDALTDILKKHRNTILNWKNGNTVMSRKIAITIWDKLGPNNTSVSHPNLWQSVTPKNNRIQEE